MTQEHPITPPPELLQRWIMEATEPSYVPTQAARWGADQELLACGNYLQHCAGWEEEDVTEFYNYRRPKSPNLKEQALKALETLPKFAIQENVDLVCVIRQALESLPDKQ